MSGPVLQGSAEGSQTLTECRVAFARGTQATGEGTHFLIPWVQRAILYDVRIKPRVRPPIFAFVLGG